MNAGGKYSEYLQPGVNVLVFNSQVPINKDKLDFATGEKIPCVTEQWLLDSIALGVKQDPTKYIGEGETPTVPVNFEPTKSRTGALQRSGKSR